jgi:hypothetical protein
VPDKKVKKSSAKSLFCLLAVFEVTVSKWNDYVYKKSEEPKKKKFILDAPVLGYPSRTAGTSSRTSRDVWFCFQVRLGSGDEAKVRQGVEYHCSPGVR